MSALALSAPRPSILDALRGPRATVAAQVAGVVGFAALAALGAQARIYIWEVPVTFQTLAVYGAGLFLGSRNGALSMGLYLLAGLAFPVFASGAFGAEYLFGTTGGYLLSYPIVALLVGMLTRRWTSFWGAAAAMTIGSVLLFTAGVTWLHFAAGHATWMESIVKGALLFIAFDLAKVWLAAGAFAGLRKVSRD